MKPIGISKGNQVLLKQNLEKLETVKGLDTFKSMGILSSQLEKIDVNGKMYNELFDLQENYPKYESLSASELQC